MAAPNSKPHVPDAPGISGLRFRHYRDQSDVPAMLAVHEGCREADQVDPWSVCYRIPNLSLADYAKDVAGSLSDGSGHNVLVAEVSGRMVGHSRLAWWTERSDEGKEKCAYLCRGWVLPEWRGKGIGLALLRWAEERAYEMDRQRGSVLGALPGELAANASDGEQDAIALLLSQGYGLRFLSPELAYDDFADLPPATTPPGFEVRPLERRHHPAVARAIIEANADLTWSPEQLKTWLDRQEPRWTEFVAGCDPTISRIGWRDGKVAGLHVCRRASNIGDVANVAVLPAFRMQGLARSLMFHCLHAMRDEGLTGARLYTGIGTDRDAPPDGPFRMYQGFGFRLIAFHNRYRKPMQQKG
ncbi:MAG: GNAT family N-acetyltransferase [Armatimonadota bacterium]